MEILVTKDRIKKLLHELKRQFVGISIGSQPGQWSDEYFELEEIKEFKHRDHALTIVLLRSRDSSYTMVDTRHIQCVRFDKLVQINGQLVDTVKFASKDTVLEFSH